MRDPELTDNDVTVFETSTSTFKCIPKETSNFNVFRLTNQHLTDTKAESIWEYYRTLFINAKLTGEGLSSFRKTLQKFIENKPYQSDAISSFDSQPLKDNLFAFLQLYPLRQCQIQPSEHTSNQCCNKN